MGEVCSGESGLSIGNVSVTELVGRNFLKNDFRLYLWLREAIGISCSSESEPLVAGPRPGLQSVFYQEMWNMHAFMEDV